ncbi:hypothetical protein STCU_10979 [Strigomonas culicis]|uniref:Uncharacterized protein n=1 Tax=Strigomonas culicis TaxID=28005 RepID=S9UQ85_9TRYP|nr:hypothetical protein STCU_10979 [Strigomonas culicis]|eukprot:EPY16806.1 hypothetical protein STCU_10979 [Strigomonas culicis]
MTTSEWLRLNLKSASKEEERKRSAEERKKESNAPFFPPSALLSRSRQRREREHRVTGPQSRSHEQTESKKEVQEWTLEQTTDATDRRLYPSFPLFFSDWVL